MPQTWFRSGLLAGHMSGLINWGVSRRRSSTVSRARCAGTLSCWKTNTSPAMLQITGSSFCVRNTSQEYCLLIFAPGSMKMSLVQPSLDTVRLARVHVSSICDMDEFWKHLVVTWAEFQQSVMECNITFSQMKKFCIYKVVQ